MPMVEIFKMLLSKILSPKTLPIKANPVTTETAARRIAVMITANNLALLAFMAFSFLLTNHFF